jgi:ABC-type branched-subunit amino acid transport system permease subunit
MCMDKPDSPESLEQALARITAQELTRNERFGHAVLASVGAIFAVGLTSLLLTEPHFPSRWVLPFVVMALIGAAWAAWALGMLLRRRPLPANREIVVGRMSVCFCALFTLGAFLTGSLVRHELVISGATWWGVTMTLIAAALLVRAHVRLASLQALRAQLEAELRAR